MSNRLPINTTEARYLHTGHLLNLPGNTERRGGLHAPRAIWRDKGYTHVVLEEDGSELKMLDGSSVETVTYHTLSRWKRDTAPADRDPRDVALLP